MDQKQLRELENRCIQEQAPTCTAECPIHIDVRGMMAEAARGDFAAGLNILRKTLPFPGIISHICEQPCQAVCKRDPIGGALNIAAIERACVMWGGAGDPVKALPRKPRKVAVVGGGLSGLTVAYDLARKGYGVDIYEAGSRLGGRVWDFIPHRLPEAMLLHDLEALVALEVEVIYQTPIGKTGHNGHIPPLSRLCEEYEAVYLGIGPFVRETYQLALDAGGRVQIDPQTRMTSQAGVFAGGGLLYSVAVGLPPVPMEGKKGRVTGEHLESIFQAPYSPIQSMLDGRRAATSIDRYLQRVSLTAARVNEGPYKTRLYTNLEGIAPQAGAPPADPASGYTKNEATTEAQRCIQCQCMECVKNCAYLDQYGGYPKKYIREIYNNLSIVMGTRYANQMINACSLCGLCGELCPEDLDMGAVCSEARQLMVDQKRMPPSAHDFALRDMAFSNSPHFALARHQPGTTASALLFFPGCQLSASRPDYIAPVYQHLCRSYAARLPQGHGVGLALRCCGAPAEWAGQRDLFQVTQAEFMAEYEQMGRPKLILACSSCYRVFKTHYPEVAIVSLWEALEEVGLPAPATPVRLSTPPALHDPCATRYETAIQDSVRRLLKGLGVEIAELPLNRSRTECCSFGGDMWLTHPELAEKTIQRRIQSAPGDFITYCAMCRDFFAREGKPTLHLLDLLYAPEPAVLASPKGPTLSDRHANRARLKRQLLKDLWDETMDDLTPAGHIRLIISPEVQEKLEKRLILHEDIRQVIENAEGSGARLQNRQTGHYLASQKLGSVTYWVEYTPQGDVYEVHNAYSHRMEIGEEGQK